MLWCRWQVEHTGVCRIALVEFATSNCRYVQVIDGVLFETPLVALDWSINQSINQSLSGVKSVSVRASVHARNRRQRTNARRSTSIVAR
jgi:hypothetical protein